MPNNWVLGVLVIVIIVQVLGKYTMIYEVLGPLGQVLLEEGPLGQLSHKP